MSVRCSASTLMTIGDVVVELEAYSNVVSVVRAQGELTKEKRDVIRLLQTMFK